MENIALVKKITNSQDPTFGFKDHLLWRDSVVSEFEDLTNHEMTDLQKKVLTSALNYRLTNSYDKDFQGLIFNKINGIYEVTFINGDTYFIHFSSEPTHVLARTTGRAGYSCEHINNDAWLGPFHDISLMNSTAYFTTIDGEWIGRLNIRWAEDTEGKVVVGIDPSIYPFSTAYADRPNELLKEAVYYILKEDLQYTTAKTPYLYKGHSDTTRTYPNVSLPFKGYDKLMQGLNPKWEQDFDWQMKFDYYAEDFA